MKILETVRSGCLTAWMQTPPGTTSDMFIRDPSKASMISAKKHIEYAHLHGLQTLELAAAHSPRTANVPAENMADPVAHHTDIETFSDGTGRDMSREAVKHLQSLCDSRLKIGTLGAFENLLAADLKVRNQNIQHILRAIRAAEALGAAGLGTEGVTIFIGRNLELSIEENFRLFVEVIVPIIRYAKDRGVILFVENCPMCGWSGTHEVFTQNIANTVLNWIIMARIIEEAGLRGWFKINYDPSHDILQGTRPEWSFKLLKKAGYAWIIGRFHGKDLSKQTGLLGMSGALGQRVAGGPWSKMSGDQPAPGATEHNPLAMANGLQVDWLGMMISAREDLGLDMSGVTFTTEFEQSQFRNSNVFRDQQHQWNVCGSIIANSAAYIQGVDLAAAANFQLRDEVTSFDATWSWQPLNPNKIELFGVGAEGVIAQAMAWKIPAIPAA